MPSPSAALAQTARVALSAAMSASPEARRCSERLAGRRLAFETLDARFVVHFEPGAIRVEAGDDPADATVRGSPAAVAATLLNAEESVAVLGDAAVFEDFRDSFRPRLDLGPGKFLLEDIGDIAGLGLRAVQSAFEGLANPPGKKHDP